MSLESYYRGELERERDKVEKLTKVNDAHARTICDYYKHIAALRKGIQHYKSANEHVWESSPPNDDECEAVGAEIEAAENEMYQALADTANDE